MVVGTRQDIEQEFLLSTNNITDQLKLADLDLSLPIDIKGNIQSSMCSNHRFV